MPGELGWHRRETRPAPLWARHLEGWQLAVLALGIALAGAALVLPRATDPSVLPQPNVDRAALRRDARVSSELARRARDEGLPFAVRAVGELVRSHGRATLTEPTRTGGIAADAVAAAARALELHGPTPLAQLEAVQNELFRAALRDWEARHAPNADARELGGDFLQQAEARGWVERGRLRLTESQRRVLFKLRWAHLLGLSSVNDLAPSIEEWREYYGIFINTPAAPTRARGGAPGRSRAEAVREQLDSVNALRRRDPSYRADLARGILELRSGRYADAEVSLRRDLEAHPTGPWRLRAQNLYATAVASGVAAGVLSPDGSGPDGSAADGLGEPLP